MSPAGPASYNDAMNSSDPLDSFLAKWQARWPEWELMSVFVPAPQRAIVAAWFTLLQELGDAAWSGREPAPGLAKLAWWQEELAGWGKGARRHPLGAPLHRLDAPWGELGRALASLPATRDDAADASLEGFARAVLACEAALFGAGAATPAALAATVEDLQLARTMGQGGALPAPAAASRAPAGLSLPRRLQLAAARERLRAQADGRTAIRPATPRLLLAGWRAARG